jgi:hypothetical protein
MILCIRPQTEKSKDWVAAHLKTDATTPAR